MSTILITGASNGIGRAFALACAASGRYTKILLNGGHDAAALEETARRVAAAGDLVKTKWYFWPNAAVREFVGLLTETSPEDWERLLRTNVTALYNTCHTYVPDMVFAGGGQILNVSSVWGLCGASCEVAYSAAKGAVNAFTRALAKELAPSRIRVNAVAPGIVDTRMNANLSDKEKAEIRDQIPAGYIVSPEEVAQAMLRLLEMPEYFTGEIVRLDGGWI